LASSGRRLGDLAGSEPRHGPPTDSPISLQYPNGRVHETTLSTPGELRPGYHFELYGRHWNALYLLESSRWKVDDERRMLCLSTSSPGEGSHGS